MFQTFNLWISISKHLQLSQIQNLQGYFHAYAMSVRHLSHYETHTKKNSGAEADPHCFTF